jgi:predicted house-cleaning noncanonical NTP pyrophosphatase (MazG superfamily)
MPDCKLIRDRMPDIIRSHGDDPVTRIAGDAEYTALLLDKLAEEAGEVAAADRADVPEELADVLEVVYAIADNLGVSRAGLEALRAGKAAERGGFAGRVVWYRDGSPRSAEGVPGQRYHDAESAVRAQLEAVDA